MKLNKTIPCIVIAFCFILSGCVSNGNDTDVSEPESISEYDTTEETTDRTDRDVSRRFSENGIELLPEAGYFTPGEDGYELTLVNIYHRVVEGFEPEIAEAVPDSDVYLWKPAALAYYSMYSAALSDGIILYPSSGYRNITTQTKNFHIKADSFIEEGYSEEEALALAARSIMPPGSSEHELGLAMDIGAIEQDFEGGSAYRWLEEHAVDYGFILRYPKDKTDITGVISEPWHWRYVGIKNAKAIKRSGLCLEEYLDRYHH